MLYQMGCCVLPSSLRPIVLEWWRHEMERIPITQLYEREPYDHGHFTYGGYDHLPAGCYAQLERDPTLVSFCNRVLRPGWAFGKRSGDLVTRGCNSAQRLHSDWPQYPTESRRLGYALVVYIALHDVPAEQAAVRVVPWCTEHYHDLSEAGIDPAWTFNHGKSTGYYTAFFTAAESTMEEVIVTNC